MQGRLYGCATMPAFLLGPSDHRSLINARSFCPRGNAALSDMSAFWEHYFFYIRKKGLMGSAKPVIARWLARTFGQWERLYVIRLVNMNPRDDDESARIVAFQHRTAVTEQVITQIRKYKSEYGVAQFLDQWFSRGATLWLYFINEDVVGVQWTIPRGFDGFYSVPIGSGEIIIVAVEVFPPFRGRGVYPKMASRLHWELGRAGYTCAYLKVATSNRPMLRSMSKISAESLGEVYTRRLGQKWLTIWGRSRP
jgi:hypothetical protein